MDQVNQGESSGGPASHPAKRRRGRPRKDQSLNPTGSADVAPGSEAAPPQQRADPTVRIDSVVGQAVTGVIEASFDSGYLVSIRTANSNTNFRGVVFKPGHIVPITAHNDLAPHLPMIRRNAVPGPTKHKYAPRKTDPLVPVVIHHIKRPNGLLQIGTDEQMVEPVSVLPTMSNNPLSNEGTSEIEQGQEMKPMTSDIDTAGSSQTSDIKTENGKECVVVDQETETINLPFSIEELAAASVANPCFSYGIGSMTELLQAVEGNVIENQVLMAEQADLAEKVEVHEKVTTDAEEEKAENVP